MEPHKQYIPPETLQLMEMGRKGLLWRVVVRYCVEAESKLLDKRNLTNQELMDFREKIFRYGLLVPVEAHHWKVIPPMDIAEVDIFKQTAYMQELWPQPTG